MNHLAAAALLSLAVQLGLAAQLVQAQAESQDSAAEPEWYRVEILVFANRDPESALSETWPLLPTLEYPREMQRLLSTPDRRPATTPYLLTPLEQRVPALPFDLAWNRSVAELEQLWLDSQRYRRPQLALEPLLDMDVPVPFARLPEQQQEFRAEQQRLERSRDISVLFHQTWLQPIRARAASLPILLDGDIENGDYPALQGSVLLYSSRYLHLETNLWLNTDGRYLDNEWVMPLPPLPAPAEPPSALFALQPDPQWLSVMDAETITTATPLDSFETDSAPAATEQEPDSDAEADTDSNADSKSKPKLDDDPVPAPIANSSVDLGPGLPSADYPFRHAVKLQQRRRMRSGELHYIDHPMLGVLIKVSRYEFAPFIDPALASPGSAATRP